MPTKIVMPNLGTFWFLINIPIVLIDAAYVLLRAPPGMYPDPSIHPYGNMAPLSWWNTYAIYDHRYHSNDDAFVVAQSYLNIAEAVLGLAALCIAMLGYYRSGLGTAIAVCWMTIYKTIIFFLMDVVEEGKFTKHNTLQDKVLMIWLPSSFWIIIPFILMLQCFSAMRDLEREVTSDTQLRRKKQQTPRIQEQEPETRLFMVWFLPKKKTSTHICNCLPIYFVSSV
eukprot:gene4189-3027_t